LVAPCGMNCGVCKTYLAYSRGVPAQKGKISHCNSCIVRDKKCAFIKRDCEKIRNKHFRFCHECPDMPCKNLDRIDKYYYAHYGVSLVENQRKIKEQGIEEFLKSQRTKFKCPNCGDVVSVHDGKCYACGFQGEKPKGNNPKARWVPTKKKQSKKQ